MKRIIRSLILFFLLFFFISSVDGATAKKNISPNKSRLGYVPHELLIKYRTHRSRQAIRTAQSQQGIRTIQRLKSIDVYRVKLSSDVSVIEAAELYKNDPDVEYAEPNYLRCAQSRIPGDTHFEKLWALNNTGQDVNGITGTSGADIDAPEAWDITIGSDDTIIAVIDSGVDYNHPDLLDNIWLNEAEAQEPDNSIDDDGNGYIDDIRGWDFYDDDNDPIDASNHGTSIAGTIAAKGDNNLGITGVCWTARIMVLKAGNSFGELPTSKIIQAIDYAIENGARIINASFAGQNYSEFEKAAISKANEAGVLFITGAGNDGTDNDEFPRYPANYELPNIITVASTDSNDELSTFSNFGFDSVDLGAPGENIYSTQPTIQAIWGDNFDDGNISEWSIKGTWGLSDSIFFSNSYSLTDSPMGFYLNDNESWALAPVFDFSSFQGIRLVFILRGISELNFDLLYIQSSTDGINWVNHDIMIEDMVFESISGEYLEDWVFAFADLGNRDRESTVYIRFYFITDSTERRNGWHIDDVAVFASSTSYEGTEYSYLSGTSAAVPHVTGLAGLILSQKPNLTVKEVKDIILESSDTNGSLMNKTLTGGRINTLNALTKRRASSSDDDSCFIATAAFGSHIEPHVKVLRDFRDRYLLKNKYTKELVSYYYRYSPSIANSIRKYDPLKTAVRIGLLPLTWVVSFFLYEKSVYKIIIISCLLILIPSIVILKRRRKLKLLDF
ncbi:MAG: S8 family serine peptidase [Thermodesulfobacteriota bacterium]|nr:S8 family serine peptidase [Thermodesulfobacteriota bacterium]